MIFCFSSENSKFEVRAGGSLPLSIIVKMICKKCKDLNQYKIPVYCDPPLMCNLTNKALARYLFRVLASCLKILTWKEWHLWEINPLAPCCWCRLFQVIPNVGRLTAQFTKHFLAFIQCTRYCITSGILKN